MHAGVSYFNLIILRIKYILQFFSLESSKSKYNTYSMNNAFRYIQGVREKIKILVGITLKIQLKEVLFPGHPVSSH